MEILIGYFLIISLLKVPVRPRKIFYLDFQIKIMKQNISSKFILYKSVWIYVALTSRDYKEGIRKTCQRLDILFMKYCSTRYQLVLEPTSVYVCLSVLLLFYST